jgi:hypothetical protein
LWYLQKKKDFMSKKSLILLLVLYVLSTGVTFGALRVLGKKSAGTANSSDQANQAAETGAAEEKSQLGQLLTIDPKEAKDQVCPLNGKLYTKTEADAWGKRRPLAVMIENSPDARPQSGLSNSDLVFEAMAEGGVTRFMAFFYCDVQKQDTTLAPVRSAREYFFQLASGFNRPLYVHVGGANTPGPADALQHIADAGWNQQNDMNQFSIGYPTFWRDYNRIESKDLATEHTMITTTEKLWTVAEKRGWTNFSPLSAQKVVTPKKKTTTTASGSAAIASTTTATPAPAGDWKDAYTPWAFQDGTAGGDVTKISFEFWDGFDAYAVRWEYDPATNSYKRFLAGEPHIDLNNKQQLMVKNAVILFAEEKGPIDDKKHMLYTVTGTGDALVFQNGKAVKAKWSKKDRESELFFTDESGKPLQFVRGLTWISMVSPKTKVAY